MPGFSNHLQRLFGRGFGGGGTRRFVAAFLYVGAAYSTPFLWSCPKKRGGAPKKNAFWRGGAPVRFRDPPASPTRVGGATRPLRCPLRGLISSLAPGARGLGWRKSRQVKVFCPAFLQKSGRGPGAAPLAARRSARNTPCAHKAQEGVKGGTLAGGSPFAGGLSRPQTLRFTDAHSNSTPGGDRTPPLRGGLRNVVRPAWAVRAGRRGRRPLRGGCGDVGPAVIQRPGGGGRPLWGFGLYTIFMRFTGQMPD